MRQYKLFHIIYLAIICLCYSGCQQDKRIDSVLLSQDSLRHQIDSIKDVIGNLNWKQSMNEFSQNVEGIAYLTPGSNGYSIIKTDIGLITVSLEDIKPYANGSRITLSIGNLTSATINGAKINIDWGTVNAKGNPNNATQKSKEYAFNKSLNAGAWTVEKIVLEEIPQSELGYVRVYDFKHTGIRLNVR